MSRNIAGRLTHEVFERANDGCEYCLLPQASQEATFHVDHIVPLSRGGATTLENLALACVSCSLRKAARHRHRDPRTRAWAPLFHPRQNAWEDHFAFTARWRIRGRTPAGRATVDALGMNRTAIIAIRNELVQLGRYPPDHVA